jgi:steroid 5-alpha reductase family enzyme
VLYSLQAQDFCRFLEYPEDHTRSGSFILGLALTIAGFEVTRQSDATLLRLRKTGKYQIPHGRLFEFVSCPHYFGELLEWTGFCIASKLSLATISFVLLTGSNLIPRAVAQHAWYHNKFKEDYPKDRKAIIPMIL